MVKLMILVFVMSALTSATYGQSNKNTLQPQQFRFQQPPSLDIRPDMNQSPCK